MPDKTITSFGHESGEGQGQEQAPSKSDRVRSLSDQKNVARLRECMEWSYKQLRPFRVRHNEAVQLAAGSRYGSGADARRKNFLNIYRMAIEVWTRQLVSQTPRAHILSRTPDFKVESYELQVALDFLLKQINFGATLAEAVRTALFSMGGIKVGLTSPYMNEAMGFLAEAGQPYAEPILFEDLLFDMVARRKEEWGWVAHRYHMPYEAVMENPDFDTKVKNKLQPDSDSDDLDGGMGFGMSGPRTSDLSVQTSLDKPEYIEKVTLWDIWIPYDNRFVTLPATQGLTALQEREWEGPEHGPIHTLGFFNVPGNIMPSAPAQHLFDIQELLTHLAGEVARQAVSQKTLTIGDGRAESEGTLEAIQSATDRDTLRVNNIDSVKVLTFPGADQGTVQMIQWLQQVESYLGGNIDVMGGLAPQSGSVGQERLLAGASSDLIKHMQSNVTEFASQVIADLGYYLYTDPISEFKLMKNIPGYKDIPFSYGPESRQGSFYNFQFEIAPYTLQQRSPAERLQGLLTLVSQVILPLSPQLSEWGWRLRPDKLVGYIMRDANYPELYEIVEKTPPPPAQPAGQEGGGPQSMLEKRRPLQGPVTTRNYSSTNVDATATPIKPGEQTAGLSAAGRGVKAATPGVMPNE